MTPEDRRRVAEGAIRFGPYEKSKAGQAIASALGLDMAEVESVLEELQNSKILALIPASRNINTGGPALEIAILFAKGPNWPVDWANLPDDELGVWL